LFDSYDEEAARWCEAVANRTREVDQAYLSEVRRSTLRCLRKSLPSDVRAQVADLLPSSVRELWLDGWTPDERVEPCATTEHLVSCVRPFVKEHHADAVIEEDVLAVTQTFFAHWPAAQPLAQPHLPADLFGATSEQGEQPIA